MTMSRIILLLIVVAGVVIAMDENSVIFTIVSFAWAGFGAVFGPIMLFSLFWKRTTRQGAVAGMVTGGVMVFLWKLVLKPLGGVFGHLRASARLFGAPGLHRGGLPFR